MDQALLAAARWAFVDQSAWITSGISALVVWQMGNRRRWAPWLGVVGQLFWVVLALHAHQPGLLPGVALFTVIHMRNAIKWRAEPAVCRAERSPAARY